MNDKEMELTTVTKIPEGVLVDHGTTNLALTGTSFTALSPNYLNTYNTLPKETVREIFMRNGFTIKEGETDLKDYVYAAAEELMLALLRRR